jgi:hypothetical protein
LKPKKAIPCPAKLLFPVVALLGFSYVSEMMIAMPGIDSYILVYSKCLSMFGMNKYSAVFLIRQIV